MKGLLRQVRRWFAGEPPRMQSGPGYTFIGLGVDPGPVRVWNYLKNHPAKLAVSLGLVVAGAVVSWAVSVLLTKLTGQG